MILSLALSMWAVPPTPPPVIEASSTIDVVIFSKAPPRRLHFHSGGCALPGLGRINTAEVSKQGVRFCRGSGAAKKCQDLPSASVTCDGLAKLSAPGVPARLYGRRFRVGRQGAGLRVVSAIDLEAYVRGVAEAELSFAPPAAKWAQMLVARTFALKAMAGPRHDDGAVCDLTHCQAFAGVPKPEPLPSARLDVLVDRQGQLADVFFHSTCGGRTIIPSRLWPALPSRDLIPVEDVDAKGQAYCRSSPHFRWVFEVDEQRLAAALEGAAGRPLDPSTLALVAVDPDFAHWKVSDRDGWVHVGGEVMHLELSRVFGFGAVKSSRFAALRAGTNFRLSGYGLGHRVGLCQMGAVARATAGQNGMEIIHAYFPALDLAKVVLK